MAWTAEDAKAWRLRNRERRATQHRAQYELRRQSPEWYAQMLARGREYHRANRDDLLAKQKVWKSDPAVKARLAAYQRSYRAAQGRRPRNLKPEYDSVAGARNANNRARRLGRVDRVTTAEVREVMAGKCALCGTTAQPSLDHIVPLSRGGLNVKSNLQRLCLPCNSAKRDEIKGVA